MTATIEETAPGAPEDGELEKITELESFQPTRVDGVDVPATGLPILMLKSLADAAPDAPASTTTEAGMTGTAVAEAPQQEAAKGTGAPAAEPGTAPAAGPPPGRGIQMNMSPRDFAKLVTFGQQLAIKQGRKTGAGSVAKDDGKKHGKPVGLTDKIKAYFTKGMSDPKQTPTRHVAQWLHRCNEWASTGSYPTGLTYSDVRWMAEQCVKILKDRVKDSTASMDGFPAAKAAKGAAPAAGGIAKCVVGSKSLDMAAEDSSGSDTRKAAAEKAAGKPEDGKGKPWKGKKPFPGASPPYKKGNDGESAPKPGPQEEDGGKAKAASPGKAEKAGKPCKCGGMLAKGDKFCSACGARAKGAATGKAAKAKNRQPEAADAKVGAAISRLEGDADAALSAQHADPDATTHPADQRVTEELERVKDDTQAAAAAQAKDEDTDDPAQHGGARKAAGDGPPYHLARLHDATCAAFTGEDVVLAHPAAARGIGHLADPAAIGKMVADALAEDAGTGSRSAEIPALSAAYHAAISLKAIGADDLGAAMEDMRKAFSEYYPDAHPKPGAITPGEFRRPYIRAGHATQAARPGQKPRIPLASHVPSPDDYKRPLITAGHEAASPGSAVKAARTYYTNAARDSASGVLGAMHDWIADRHPEVCPMKGGTYDGEDAVPGSMGSSLTTAAPVPEKFAATKDTAVPVPVSAGHAASVVTPHVTKGRKARKGAGKEAKAMAKAAKAARKAAGAQPAAVPAAPVLDPELLKSALRDVIGAELDGIITKANGPLIERVAALESAPDPAQMAPRSGAGLARARNGSPEVPAGGDGHEAERLARLVKRAKDPDGGVRTAAIGELIEKAGREAAVQLLEAAY